MPVKNEYKSNGVLITCTDIVNGSELLKSNSGSYKHVYPDGLKFQLVDYSDTTELRLTSKQIEALAAQDSEYLICNPPYIGVLVAKSDFIYGMCRMWQIILDNTPFDTFVARTYQQALEWLHSKDITI